WLHVYTACQASARTPPHILEENGIVRCGAIHRESIVHEVPPLYSIPKPANSPSHQAEIVRDLSKRQSDLLVLAPKANRQFPDVAMSASQSGQQKFLLAAPT